VLHDLGVVKHAEPFTRLVHQGLILGMSYRWYAKVDGAGNVLTAYPGNAPVEADGQGGWRLLGSGEAVELRWANESQIVMQEGAPVHAEHRVAVVPVAEKMSKSRGNVVNPDEVIEEYGADSLRLYEMFMGPLEQSKPWQTAGLLGVRRFLDRVHNVASRTLSAEAMELETARLVHRTVKKVTEDIAGMRFNTAISAMMILANHLASQESPSRQAVEALLLCLSPFAPHLCEELWEQLGHSTCIAEASWPSWDEALCVDAEVELAIQVNGKVRGRITVAKDAGEAVVREAALAEPNVQKFLEGKSVRKFIFVPGKIANLIVG